MFPRKLTTIIAILTMGWMLFLPTDVMAIPQEATFDAEQIAIAQVGTTMTIDQSVDKAIIDWQDYSIAADELVQYIQPNADAIALNKISGANPSEIMGDITANGQIFIMNPNGILFGPNSHVNTAGLLATTLNITDEDFLEGNYEFSQDQYKELAYIINEGEITISDNGYAVLAAPLVSNEGLIVANLGKVAVGAAEEFTINFDGRNLINFEITTPPEGSTPGTVLIPTDSITDIITQVVNFDTLIEEGCVEEADGTTSLVASSGLIINDGTITADGSEGNAAGGVLIQATQVAYNNTDAVISANGVGESSASGKIEINAAKVGHLGTMHADATNSDGGDIDVYASKLIVFAPGSLTTANPGANGNGGEVIIFSEDTAIFWDDATIEVKGGSESGDGGFVEVSGVKSVMVDGRANRSAPNGLAGTLLIDPDLLTIIAGGAANPFTWLWDGDYTGVWEQLDSPVNMGVDILLSHLGDGPVYLEASGDITLSTPLTYAGNNDLTMTAGGEGEIQINEEINFTGAASLTLLNSGADVDAEFHIDAEINLNSGNLTITNFPGGGTLDIGIGFPVTVVSGDITFTANMVDLKAAVIATAGTFTMKPVDATDDIGINSGGAEPFNFNTNELGYMQGKYNIIGRNDGTGDITIGEITHGFPLEILTNTGSIIVNGAITMTGSAYLTLGAVGVGGGAIDINAAIITNNANFITYGTTFDNTGGAITTVGGDVTLSHSGAVTVAAAITTTAAANSGTPSGVVDINVSGTSIATLAGNIVTTGADNNGGTASAGGAVTIDTTNGTIGITGDITTSGGDSSGGDGSGGAAGGITITTATNNVTTLNNNTLTAAGGAKNGSGTAGAGATINFDDPVTLATGIVTMTTGATAGDIIFDQVLIGAQPLTLTSGLGVITFSQAVGSGTPLGLVTINDAAAVKAWSTFQCAGFSQTTAGTGTIQFVGL
ncbi:MAG: filamentous hemagglutinin N-terminal domain-containing protein, partial [Waddliaceae bacterium]|nr:filamentous hemagglutinin N-terminal domain-containing protein [Waddliaceae bacterium]MBT4444997.1 filamentous hemagglutinin N-terminal domain-containing protein [Waddliaceae bacterium]MBT6928268.1 filamentous hemagglutinin N-terminal domain-containing protein [Waddliaceae bacterium]MBT7264213.1 filamentous hemagglutinin N-terminal domain-containing protein [Waddliaceae bacterium]